MHISLASGFNSQGEKKRNPCSRISPNRQYDTGWMHKLEVPMMCSFLLKPDLFTALSSWMIYEVPFWFGLSSFSHSLHLMCFPFRWVSLKGQLKPEWANPLMFKDFTHPKEITTCITHQNGSLRRVGIAEELKWSWAPELHFNGAVGHNIYSLSISCSTILECV